MSLFNGISRHPASFPFAASVDLARLAEVSGLLGLSLTAGQELQSLGVGLNQNYPDGFSSFSLDPDHQTALESLRQNQPAVDDPVVPALEALALKRAQMAARPSQAPMAATPGARLQRSRSIPAPGLLRPPMGGVAVPTSEGLIQFGTPMWLNKWVHRLYWKSGGTGIGRDDVKYKIPTYYIHDSEFSGPNVGLLPYDFIGYLGFPVESTVFTMVAEDAQQAARLRNYLDDSYLGKRHPDLSARVRAEYPEDAIGVPDLLAEMTQGFASPD